MTEPAPFGLWCAGLSVRYRLASGTVEALNDVTAVFPPGALNVVAGPSGSGKSTLLRQLALLERPTAGSIRLDGRELTALSERARRRVRRLEIGYVFQRPTDNLVDYLDAIGQLTLAAELRGGRRSDARAHLDSVGLGHRGRHTPAHLSGGEQQRLAFAAANVAAGPGRSLLIIADEPTAQLDARSARTVIDALVGLRDLGASIVVCSHDPAVLAVAEHSIHLEFGRVVEQSHG